MQSGGTAWDIRSLMTYPFALGMLIALAVYLLIFLVPIMKVLRRTGHNPLWSLFVIFPGLNVIMLWVFAFKPWPKAEKAEPTK